MRNLSLVCLLSFGLVITPAIATAQSGTLSGPPTEISADLGTCSALITVKDKDSKPIYNAKITARIRYGMMGAKKLDLETFTNSAGQAKIVKLPEVPKKPIYFYVSKDEMLEIVEFAPDAHCEATFDVVLK
jgi:hypothetical protein